MKKMRVEGQIPAPGKEDMDWTEPCLEMGTKFTINGAMRVEQVPVEQAWVKDEMFYFVGHVWVDV